MRVRAVRGGGQARPRGARVERLEGGHGVAGRLLGRPCRRKRRKGKEGDWAAGHAREEGKERRELGQAWEGRGRD